MISFLPFVLVFLQFNIFTVGFTTEKVIFRKCICLNLEFKVSQPG